jgi:hypothetical protein
MSVNAPITPGHTFTTGDTLTATLLNKAFTLARAVVPTPISVANGGTGATTAANAQKNTQSVGRLEAWVEYTDDGTPVTVGTLPADSFVDDIKIHVTEAFNSGTSDNVEVGWSADQNALSTSQDVSSTGVLEPTHGANDGYNSAQKSVTALLTSAGTAATTGKALVVVFYAQVTTEP